MLFNSISFALFLPVVFILYWFVTAKSLKWQNILLLISSYFFYACWDYRFLFLLIFSTVLDFYVKDGKRVCEIMVGRWFKSDMSDEKLLEYLKYIMYLIKMELLIWKY